MSDICVCGHSWDVHFAAQCANCFCKRKQPTNEDALAKVQEILTGLCEAIVDNNQGAVLGIMDRAEDWLHARGVKLSYEKEENE